MHRTALCAALLLGAGPALAASDKPFFSLANTDFVVLIGFVIFIGLLLYFRIPSIVGGMLDNRAEHIRSELDEARALREEAQTLLASYERQQREVAEQAERIVALAKEEAGRAAEEAKAELERSLARRLESAEEQIASAEAAALRGVRNEAVRVAVAAAGDMLSKQMTATQANKLIDASIDTVGDRLN